MEVVDEQSARLCDSEVLALVRESHEARSKEKRQRRGHQSELATVEHQLISYFKELDLPSTHQTPAHVQALQVALKPYNLKRNELLQIVNTRPTLPVELAIVLSNPDSHEHHLEDMLAAIGEALPVPPKRT
ncbi:hypothetical protein M427DRAFT_248270 [Gonapodya prolifera JEL478]|uniref:DNA-directed RNA polymerase III subunit RPC9 n=1 Tax=Gonapodya prolifera (strain JEL478) TaxID=1344416 RepID=A0A138ZYL5_GONPJ|nr:hypothetical protein M427DRAFT_248270 [Gonapodya prolifera JEL478]|eukprot:KXS09213.1 hypothetical protein M427DRAFT_248270 [Gonapodya prolifera JEL478]